MSLGCVITYRPALYRKNSTHIASEDVPIIVPTINAGEEFNGAADSWPAGKPKEIYIIIVEKMPGLAISSHKSSQS